MLDAGMNGHIGKPLDFDEVLSTLKVYLYLFSMASSRVTK